MGTILRLRSYIFFLLSFRSDLYYAKFNNNGLEEGDSTFFEQKINTGNVLSNRITSYFESYGFFKEKDSIWALRKEKARRQKQKQNNWEPDFSCLFEERVGHHGDGGKWVCDVVKLVKKRNCLVYSFGSRGDFSFEIDLHSRLSNCEIHVFDHTLISDPNFSMTSLDIPNFIKFHHIGLGSNQDNLQTVEQIRDLLGHKNRKIDILKIDIDGGEYTASFESLHSNATQVLIEIHPSSISNMHEILKKFQLAGYAIFHKEPNIAFPNSQGKVAVEYCFIRLKPSFWE